MYPISHLLTNLEVTILAWMLDLYETYDTIIGLPPNQRATLTPIAHSSHKSQIEMLIDLDGNLIDAKVIDETNQTTIIPVTEDSATRSSGIAPHPLSDKLAYVAGDYGQYVKKSDPKKYTAYAEGLSQWANSTFCNDRIRSVDTYIKKGTIMADLIELNILHAENGLLLAEKILGVNSADCVVRFDVRADSFDSEYFNPLYLDQEIFDCYTKYYFSKSQNKNLCYITGKEIPCTSKHPARIRHPADKSKLISANDTSGFTYRGRLTDASQVASVGYEVSQKAHSALRWLIENQSFRMEEMTIIAWEKTNKHIVSPIASTEDGLFDDDEDTVIATTNQGYSQRLFKAAAGYRAKLNTQSNIVVIAVEAATTGRLSIVFYESLNGSQFMDNITVWHSTCYWSYRYKKFDPSTQKNIYRQVVGAPSLKNIAEAIFDDKNKKVLKSTIQRLLPCVVDGKNFPKDLMRIAVARASTRGSFEHALEYQNQVAITCALIRKVRYDYFKEDWNMALDKTITDRNYLFGRLLGAAQKLEESALYYDNEKARLTAAERYSQQFAKTPAKTWGIIDSALAPYKAKLKARGKTWSCKELQEIYDLIDPVEFMNRAPLSELYLLGYNCQLNSYYKSDDLKEDEINE